MFMHTYASSRVKRKSFYRKSELLALVVQTLDSAIHRIKIYPVVTQLVSLILIHWIVIYPVDSTIQRLNNRGQMFVF